MQRMGSAEIEQAHLSYKVLQSSGMEGEESTSINLSKDVNLHSFRPLDLGFTTSPGIGGWRGITHALGGSSRVMRANQGKSKSSNDEAENEQSTNLVVACLCCGTPEAELQGVHRVRLGKKSMYVGEWGAGLPNGSGRWHNMTLGTYEGEWKKGHLHGAGLWIWPNGDALDGMFVGSNPTGWCTLTKGDGNQRRVEFDGSRAILDPGLAPRFVVLSSLPPTTQALVDPPHTTTCNKGLLGDDDFEARVESATVVIGVGSGDGQGRWGSPSRVTRTPSVEQLMDSLITEYKRRKSEGSIISPIRR